METPYRESEEGGNRYVIPNNTGFPMINESELKNRILNFVKQNNGCKIFDVKRMQDSEVLQALLSKYDLDDILKDLIIENKLIEIQYTTPGSSLPINRFILPSGSKIL